MLEAGRKELARVLFEEHSAGVERGHLDADHRRL